MSAQLSRINDSGPAATEPIRVPLPQMAEGAAESAEGSKPQVSPFGPDYIVETSQSPKEKVSSQDPKKTETQVVRTEHVAPAGVVPFGATTGPGADLAALPPLEPLGTATLTELSLNKLMQPSRQANVTGSSH